MRSFWQVSDSARRAWDLSLRTATSFLAFSAASLSPSTLAYINRMERSGSSKFTICGLNCLAVHGSLDDPYWKAISPSDVHGDYSEYDLVFSGHSHYSHFFTCFYPGNDPLLRNKKAVSFINPGSVGQPRNRNPLAQYAVLSLPSRRVELRSTEYDIAYEQSLYPSVVDEFYKTRLTYGV